MVPLPSQFPPAPIHTSWAPNHLLPGKLPSPEPRNLSPTSMAPPTAPLSQSPSSLMPETLSICRRALGRVPLTPCCWSCLDDGRVNRTGADSPPPLFTALERLQLWILSESWRCFRVAVDRRDIALSLPPIATTTALASPTRQLDLPTSPCRQIGRPSSQITLFRHQLSEFLFWANRFPMGSSTPRGGGAPRLPVGWCLT